MLTIGDVTIARVEEFVMPVPISYICPDAGMVAANRHWLNPNFLSADGVRFPFVFQSWVVRCNGVTIVVDPCNGNGRDRPAMQQFHRLNTPFLERFAATGTDPAEVDFVFCTHLHCDHCGWNTRRRGEDWVPTFPNARYLFVRREVERWDPVNPGHQVVDYNIGVFEDSVLPVIRAGLADLVADTHEIMPGLTILPAYGHTYAHSILRISTGAAPLYCTGDVFHHPLQLLDPALHLPGCDDLDMAISTRGHLREILASEKAVMLPAHFPAPHAGRVVRDRNGYRFIPLDH